MKRTAVIILRITDTDKELLKKLADRNHQTMSDFVRDAINEIVADCHDGVSPFRKEHQPLVRKWHRKPIHRRVYFISDGELVKIGFSLNVEKRLQQLSFEAGKPLTVLATVEGGPALERKYHEQFASYRVRGEWFRLTPELSSEIQKLRTPVAA